MSDEFSVKLNLPFFMGMQLAVNAVSDAHLLTDASDCVMSFAEFHKNHDLNSGLLDPWGAHRVFHTNADVHSTAINRTPDIEKTLRMMEQSGDVKALFFSSVPMTIITGYQYDKIIRGMKPPLKIPVVEIPRKGLLGDWLDGYAAALKALASAAAPPDLPPDPNSAVIVGYLMDRSEEDHLGNLRELNRTIETGLGLRASHTWLSNLTFSHHSKLDNAGIVISLPYAREAARIIADKCGAKLVETDLPVGLEATARWINTVAQAACREDRARAFIESELSAHIPKLEWTVRKCFTAKRINISGDPHIHAALCELASELGAVPETGAIFAQPDAQGCQCGSSCETGAASFHEALLRGRAAAPPDLYIGNSIALKEVRAALGPHVPAMEFGYPSYSRHEVFDAPFMGYRGAMCLINRIANAISGAGA